MLMSPRLGVIGREESTEISLPAVPTDRTMLSAENFLPACPGVYQTVAKPVRFIFTIITFSRVSELTIWK